MTRYPFLPSMVLRPLPSKKRSVSTTSVLPRHGVLVWNPGHSVGKVPVGELSLSCRAKSALAYRQSIAQRFKTCKMLFRLSRRALPPRHECAGLPSPISVKALASYLSDDFAGRGFLPQPVQKAQYLDFMQAIMMAMPDWSFHDRLLDEGPVTEQGERALFITQITGTHTGDLILPDLPVIPATGTKISLPYRHLEYFVNEKTIMTLTADFSPNALEEILAQIGMVLPW